MSIDKKQIVFVGMKELDADIRGQIAMIFQEEQYQLVFVDKEQYNANVDVLYKKLLKIKGDFKLREFLEDPKNIESAESWRNWLIKFDKLGRFFRLTDFARMTKNKPSEAKEILNQLSLFGIVELTEIDNRRMYKFFPNDEVRISHYESVIAGKLGEIDEIKRVIEGLKETIKEEKEEDICKDCGTQGDCDNCEIYPIKEGKTLAEELTGDVEELGDKHNKEMAIKVCKECIKDDCKGCSIYDLQNNEEELKQSKKDEAN